MESNMSKMKNLSSEEKNAIQELKNRVKKELSSPDLIEDALLHKFLKVRNFDIDKAEKMLRKHIKWRKVYQVESILQTFKPKEVFTKYVEPRPFGFDKDGDVIHYFHGGPVNNTELMKCIKFSDCTKHWIWFAEKTISVAKQKSEKTGKMTFLSFILDLDGLEFANATSKISADICLQMARYLQDNYRQRFKSVYVINAPSYCVFVLKIVKAVLSYGMMKKLHVFGYSGWKEKLREVIDDDVLPAFLGGKRTDPDGDPYCRSFISRPGKISESYYLSEEERYFEDRDEVNTLVLRPSEKKELFVHVQEPGSWIKWKFMVKYKTIGFGLLFEESQDVLKEIIPMYEYDTSDGTEENFYRCSSKGKYVIIFDNSCSKFTTKEIKYSLTVEKPEV